MNIDRKQLEALGAAPELVALPVDRKLRVALLMRLLAEALPEPAPKEAEGDLWADLMRQRWFPAGLRQEAEARRLLGIARYGRPLQADNGRDHLRDCLDEMLDGAVYAYAVGEYGLVGQILNSAAYVQRLMGTPASLRSIR